MPVNFIGLKKLDDMEIARMQTLVDRESKKIFRPKHKLEEAKLSVNVKTKNVEGKQKLYEIILKLDSRSTKHSIFDVKHEDWDMERAVHRAFENMMALLEHNLKAKRGGSYKDA